LRGLGSTLRIGSFAELLGCRVTFSVVGLGSDCFLSDLLVSFVESADPGVGVLLLPVSLMFFVIVGRASDDMLTFNSWALRTTVGRERMSRTDGRLR